MEKKKEVVDDFFQEVSNNKPYLKASFLGFAGSGKTFTAAKLAIGLHQRVKSTKPIVMVDTEKASKFLKPLFDEAGIKLLVRETKSLVDLREAMTKCREGFSDILLIDSITHIYENFMDSYKVKTGHQRFQFQDWAIIKPAWKKEYTDMMVNDPYHIIFCGRAGYEYGNEINEETGKREIFKSGVKMKVEGETAYESDMITLMERFEEILSKDKKVWREATIVKDRSNLIDGKQFKNPVYENFAPVIEAMLSNISKTKQSPMGDDTKIIQTEEDNREFFRQRDIKIENIEGLITSFLPGQSAAEKKLKTDIVEIAFGTRSWTEVGRMNLAQLEHGIQIIKKELPKLLAKQEKEKESK